MPQGALIQETVILNQDGKPANLLVPRQNYRLSFQAAFPQPASLVRFTMTVKTVEGLEIAGAQSHGDGDGVTFVEAGTKYLVRFPFAARLAPGTYFVDIAVTSEIEGRRTELQRILDAATFRVVADSERRITGLVDLSVEPVCEMTPFVPNKQAARGRKHAK